jgi:hypothetical protein
MMLQQVGRLLQIRPLLASIAVALFPDPPQVGLQRLFKTKLKAARPTCKVRIRAGLLPEFYQL